MTLVLWLVERWAEGQNIRRTIIRQKEIKYPRLYAPLPEVQLTRDSRDREEEEVEGGVERLPSPAMRRLQRWEAEDHWGGCMHLIYGGVLMWCCHFQTEWWLSGDRLISRPLEWFVAFVKSPHKFLTSWGWCYHGLEPRSLCRGYKKKYML